jgi:hypothetical protein
LIKNLWMMDKKEKPNSNDSNLKNWLTKPYLYSLLFL